MKLKSPFIITARLLPGVQIADSFISIEFSKRLGSESRARYQWYIDTPTFKINRDTLQSGCGGGTLQEGMASLLSLLGAAADAYAYEMRGGHSAHSDLFNEKINKWAYQHSDEISMIQVEIEETPDLIIA
jgi:hypothetical protein